jgi:hypothetical protein
LYCAAPGKRPDATFETALRELRASRPGIAFEALVRRADLRRRQGRFEEAAELYRQVEFHPYAQLGLAHVALDSGDAVLAADRAMKFLRKLGPESRLQRAAGLDLYSRALVALGEAERARRAHGELRASPRRSAATRCVRRRSLLRVSSPKAKVTWIPRARASRTPSICFNGAATRLRRRGHALTWRGYLPD